MQTIGPYRIESEVARGGMGVVYRAVDAAGRPVALKVLLEQRLQSPNALRRYEVEVGALARLRHPHVVQVLGAGEHEGAPWLALEFVEGETLEDRLRRGPLPIAEALRLIRQLTLAIAYVHACGVLHRDLKPANVLLRDGDALLTDFGLARDDGTLRSRVTATGAFLGTPGYWSPEQSRGLAHEEVDARADVYGLGALLFAALTGRPPVVKEAYPQYFTPDAFDGIPRLRELRPEVPDWLDALCARCLAEDPAERPPSANALARELATGGGPGRAGRRPALLVGAVAAVALAAVSAAAVLALWRARTPPPVDAPPTHAPPTDAPPTDAPADPPRPADPSPPAAPRLDAEAYLARAAQAIDAGEPAAALDDLQQALELDPSLSAAFAERGRAKVALGRAAEAILDFDRALALAPEAPNTYANRGAARQSLGHLNEAYQDYEEALRLDPDHARALANRATVLGTVGRPTEALRDFDRAIELDPDLPLVHFQRGMTLQTLGRNEEALRDYDEALRRDPTNGRAYAERAALRSNLGQLEAALGDFDRALELGPVTPLTLVNRGMTRSKAGLGEQAIADFDEALRLDPRLFAAWVNRAVAKTALGRHAEAVADFDRALALSPSPQHTAELRKLRDAAEQAAGQ